MSSDAALTPTDITAAASATLERNGYRRLPYYPNTIKQFAGARFFEDPYGIVEVVVYENWSELEANWTEAQATLVELISKYVSNSEAKAWDGYLVLLTPGLQPLSARSEATAIRYNINRVRKLLAAGDELRTLGDVDRVLQPLLPVSGQIATTEQPDRVLSLLPEILGQHGIPSDDVSVIVEAFVRQNLLMEKLHESRFGDENN
jgi:hypothetical protein